MANQDLMRAALEFSAWLEDFWHSRPEKVTAKQQANRHKMFLSKWKVYRTRMERIVNRELRENAIRLVLEGATETEILRRIASSNDRREAELTTRSEQNERQSEAEKLRTARRREQRKLRKKRQGAWKEV